MWLSWGFDKKIYQSIIVKYFLVMLSVRFEFKSSVDGWLAGWLGGPVIIVPLRGSILQAETCQILSLAENPRWSPSVAIVFSSN